MTPDRLRELIEGDADLEHSTLPIAVARGLLELWEAAEEILKELEATGWRSSAAKQGRKALTALEEA